MIQEMIVGLVVTLAACFVMVHFAPRTLRQAFHAVLTRLARRCQWTWLERKLIVRSLTQVAKQKGCGACNACTPDSEQAKMCSSITPEKLQRTIRR